MFLNFRPYTWHWMWAVGFWAKNISYGLPSTQVSSSDYDFLPYFLTSGAHWCPAGARWAQGPQRQLWHGFQPMTAHKRVPVTHSGTRCCQDRVQSPCRAQPYQFKVPSTPRLWGPTQPAGSTASADAAKVAQGSRRWQHRSWTLPDHGESCPAPAGAKRERGNSHSLSAADELPRQPTANAAFTFPRTGQPTRFLPVPIPCLPTGRTSRAQGSPGSAASEAAKGTDIPNSTAPGTSAASNSKKTNKQKKIIPYVLKEKFLKWLFFWSIFLPCFGEFF